MKAEKKQTSGVGARSRLFSLELYDVDCLAYATITFE